MRNYLTQGCLQACLGNPLDCYGMERSSAQRLGSFPRWGPKGEEMEKEAQKGGSVILSMFLSTRE